MQENTVEKTVANEIIPEVYEEMGIIGPDTKVVGDIQTKGHLTVRGFVQGDIDAKGNVIVAGRVEGNIRCSNLHMGSTGMGGDSVSKDEAVLKGTATCKDVTVTGTVLGDITASGKIGLAKTALVKGNIKAASMGMELGARLEGCVAITE